MLCSAANLELWAGTTRSSRSAVSSKTWLPRGDDAPHGFTNRKESAAALAPVIVNPWPGTKFRRPFTPRVVPKHPKMMLRPAAEAANALAAALLPARLPGWAFRRSHGVASVRSKYNTPQG